MQFWTEFLALKEKELGKDIVEKWLKPLKVTYFNEAHLHLEANDTFQAQWFNEYIKPKLKDELKNQRNKPIKVYIKVANKSSRVRAKDFGQADQYSPKMDVIDPTHNLEQFVEFDQNKIALKIARDFKRQKSPIYNPIYFYGETGIGKTHLLHAIYHVCTQNKSKVIYVRLKTFMENMVRAIKFSQMPQFRKLYREVDILIIDDVDQLSNKTATQEELFHTFNALHTQNKQIIVGSTCNPQQLKSIEPRLISRFEWGIVIPLQNPSDVQLKRILDSKVKALNFPLVQTSKDFLVKRFNKNPQILQRALNTLILRSHLKMPQGKKMRSSYLSPESISLLLKDMIQKQAQEEITLERILDIVAHYFGIQPQDILGKSQARECAQPRQICMYFCREFLKHPYMKIGKLFARDHSTVMSSVKQIEQNLRQKPDLDSSRCVVALKETLVKSHKQLV